jgi:uncharacterized protein (DUF488 family)
VTIYTIGHSNRTTKEFLDLLRKNGVERLVDIRLIPKSRANPQFGQGRLQRSLERAGIDYAHEPRMGGRRRAAKESINAGWRNASFRGYADHMATREFKDALKELLARARKQTTAIMCAEAVPWRCHRTLVADALTHKRARVLHIVGGATPRPHKYTPFLRIKRGALTYPAY